MAIGARVNVLTVNAGSSSLKLALVVDGRVEREYADLDAVLAGPAPDAVGHRVVHGGPRTSPVVVDDRVRRELGALVDLAPLHQPPSLAALDACRSAWSGVTQVACFDTAFHATIPPAASTYALPAAWRAAGVRVYGFHGLSVAWVASRLPMLAPGARRVLVAHLGSGSSLTAVVDGRSVATTMGFTPSDGLVMGTRSGAVDPGALLWLARSRGVTIDELADGLERRSGLLGLAGAADFRQVAAAAADGSADAVLALDVWWHRLVVLAGGMVAAMGGVDAVVLTGGIGEHADTVRVGVAERLAFLGVGGQAPLFVVPAREDLQVAVEVEGLLGRD